MEPNVKEVKIKKDNEAIIITTNEKIKENNSTVFIDIIDYKKKIFKLHFKFNNINNVFNNYNIKEYKIPDIDWTNKPNLLRLIEFKNNNFEIITYKYDDLKKNKYVALSYTWGNSCKLLNNSERNSVLNNASKIFTNQMSYDNNMHYLSNIIANIWKIIIKKNMPNKLWIDNICIFQENKKDVNLHLNNMGFIYYNADNVSIYLEKEDSWLLDFMNCLKQGNGDVLTSSISSKSWLSRGWTLQEIVNSKKSFFIFKENVVSTPLFNEISINILRSISTITLDTRFHEMMKWNSYKNRKMTFSDILLGLKKRTFSDIKDLKFALIALSKIDSTCLTIKKEKDIYDIAISNRDYSLIGSAGKRSNIYGFTCFVKLNEIKYSIGIPEIINNNIVGVFCKNRPKIKKTYYYCNKCLNEKLEYLKNYMSDVRQPNIKCTHEKNDKKLNISFQEVYKIVNKNKLYINIDGTNGYLAINNKKIRNWISSGCIAIICNKYYEICMDVALSITPISILDENKSLINFR